MHKCWMYLPSRWGVQMTVNSFVWCWPWTVKWCSEHFYFHRRGWEVSKRLYADICVMRDEEKTRRLFTDSADHLQLDMQIDMKWSKQSKAELLHLLRLSRRTFLHPLTSTSTLAASIHTSNASWNKHLHQDFPVAFACTPQFKHENDFCFPGYRLGIAHFI